MKKTFADGINEIKGFATNCNWMTDKEIKIYNDGMKMGHKLAWKRIRELLNPIYRNTREKPLINSLGEK